ncbi:MAG: LysM peptidoglycan-binding domain-containing protein, partial [Spirochaetes bacterium]|nr:LysM peptidoglycan-binding domain-containing protein [Spirochaetota bacterium]
LITKKVRDPRIVEASDLNRLPIRLPHNIVYGCYPDSESGAMRLILNMESMAVHFDKKSVKEFFHAFSLDTGQSPVAEIPEQLPENDRPSGIEEPASSEIIRPEESQPAMTSGEEEHAGAAEVNEMPMPVEIKENINPDIPVHETQAPEEERAFPDVAAENKTGPINESPVSASSAGTAESDKLPADFPPQESATEPPLSSEEPVYNSYADEKISSAYEEIVLDEDKYFAEVPGETTREEITPSKSDTAESAAGETAEPEPAAAETDVLTANFPEETPATSDSRVIYPEAQNIKKESEYIAGLTTEAKQEAEIEEKSDAGAYQESVTADSAKENMPENVPEEKIAGPVLIPAKTHPSTKNTYQHASLGLLVIILIFLISAFLLSRRSADDKPEQPVMPVKEKITAQKEDTLQKEEVSVPIDNKREETGKAEPEKSEQNEMKIGEAPVTPEKKAGKLKYLPSKYDSRTDWDSSSDFIIYNVIQGDELYYITEQFTGNGFDYWNIARDNKIDNPDLIFPEQKIKLRKNYIRK